MERVIKFRALCDYDAEGDAMSGMLFFDPLKCDNGIYCTPNPDDIWHINEYLSPLMQFTGLLDKNGVEIYESDLFELIYENAFNEKIERIGEVVFFMSRWMVKHIHPLTEEQAFADLHSLIKKNTKQIIGNIHANPELLSTPLK